jgi:putative transposase
MGKIELANGEYYHIHNRGVDKRIVFQDEKDFARFLQSIVEFNAVDPIGSLYENSFRKLGSSTSKLEKKLVEIIGYCLNPNHYHILLKQVTEKGVEKFMHRLSTGYSKYFNEKNKRSGALFQGRYKAKHINTNEYLFYVSVYVNLNYKVHQLGSSTSKSSYEEYKRWKKIDKEGICCRDLIMGEFKNFRYYDKFSKQTLAGIKDRKKLKKIWKNIELGS